MLRRDKDHFVEKAKPGYVESMVKVVEDVGEKVEGTRTVSTPGERLDLSNEEGLQEVTPAFHTAFRQVDPKP